MKLIVRLAMVALTLPSIAAAGTSIDEGPYRIGARIAGTVGSYDYASVDPALGKLFVGRDFGVETLDLNTGRYRTLLTRKGVAAVLPIGAEQMLSTNGALNTATLFDRRTGKVVADIATGEEPDGAYYDAGSGLAFVANGGSRDLTVIDIAQAKAVATIPVDGVPEAAVSDGQGRLFVNLEDRNAVAVIDIARRQVAGRYALPGCEEPTGIAYDAQSGLLISACHNGVAKQIAVRSRSGRGPTDRCSIRFAASDSSPVSMAR